MGFFNSRYEENVYSIEFQPFEYLKLVPVSQTLTGSVLDLDLNLIDQIRKFTVCNVTKGLQDLNRRSGPLRKR